MSLVNVSVRVRPLLAAEKGPSVVSMKDKSTVLTIPPESHFHSQRTKALSKQGFVPGPEHRKYSFDDSVWSFDGSDSSFVDNYDFYHRIGPDILNHLFLGFNVCLLAYGQTSSGKTYTMMGDKANPGLVSLLIEDVLRQKQEKISQRIDCRLSISYYEIYNEQVNDLLSSTQKKCRVREHPVTGPYVEGVDSVELTSYEDFVHILANGNAKRATASTSMNDKSSRSHAIITITLQQTQFAEDYDVLGAAEEQLVSNIKLVDLAGSERLNKTKVYGQTERIKEGTLINKSLTVLGRCFTLLATGTSNVVPFRDSILTYILKENLAGNSKSFMIFCVSPVDFEETFQTLNYADQVKKIKTAARVNKTKLATVQITGQQKLDQSIINDLKDEIKILTEKFNRASTQSESVSNDKTIKLVSYLESETSKLQFENAFLKQKLEQKSADVQNSRLEMLNAMAELYEEKMKREVFAKKALSHEIDIHKRHVSHLLSEFDPQKLLII